MSWETIAAGITDRQVLALLKPVLYLIYGAARILNTLGIYRRSLEPLDLRDWDRRTRAGELDLTMLASLGVDLRATPVAAYVRMLAATTEAWPDVAAIRVPALALMSSRSTMTDAKRTREALKGVAVREAAEPSAASPR